MFVQLITDNTEVEKKHLTQIIFTLGDEYTIDKLFVN